MQLCTWYGLADQTAQHGLGCCPCDIKYQVNTSYPVPILLEACVWTGRLGLNHEQFLALTHSPFLVHRCRGGIDSLRRHGGGVSSDGPASNVESCAASLAPARPQAWPPWPPPAVPSAFIDLVMPGTPPPCAVRSAPVWPIACPPTPPLGSYT